MIVIFLGFNLIKALSLNLLVIIIIVVIIFFIYISLVNLLAPLFFSISFFVFFNNINS